MVFRVLCVAVIASRGPHAIDSPCISIQRLASERDCVRSVRGYCSRSIAFAPFGRDFLCPENVNFFIFVSTGLRIYSFSLTFFFVFSGLKKVDRICEKMSFKIQRDCQKPLFIFTLILYRVFADIATNLHFIKKWLFILLVYVR